MDFYSTCHAFCNSFVPHSLLKARLVKWGLFYLPPNKSSFLTFDLSKKGLIKKKKQERNCSKTVARPCFFLSLEHWCLSWPGSAQSTVFCLKLHSKIFRRLVLMLDIQIVLQCGLGKFVISLGRLVFLLVIQIDLQGVLVKTQMFYDTFFPLQSFRWNYSVSRGNCLGHHIPLEANQIAQHCFWMRSNPNSSENQDTWFSPEPLRLTYSVSRWNCHLARHPW